MQHLFIINPKSFEGNTELASIKEEIMRAVSKTRETCKIHVSRAPRDAIGIINRFAESAPQGETIRIYAVGDDEILFDCVNGCIGLLHVEVTSVPYGSLNSFIRSFGNNSQSAFRDIKLLIYAPAAATDVMNCGSVYAINNCSVGIEANIVHKLAVLSSKISKYTLLKLFLPLLACWYEFSIAVQTAYSRDQCTIIIDGEHFAGHFGIISIGNGAYGFGNKPSQPLALPNDGLLDVIIYKSPKLVSVIRYFRKFTKGSSYKYPQEFIYRRAKHVEVKSDTPLVISLDGETHRETKLVVDVVPNAINFAAPYGLKYKPARKEYVK